MEVLQRSLERKTNLFKELITKLRVGNGKVLEELALETRMLDLGRSPHGCSDFGVAPLILISLIIVLSCRIIGGLPNLLLQVIINK